MSTAKPQKISILFFENSNRIGRLLAESAKTKGAQKRINQARLESDNLQKTDITRGTAQLRGLR